MCCPTCFARYYAADVSRRPTFRRGAAAVPPARRDRHGRGVRGPLAPTGSPLALSRAQRFDELVVDVVDRLHRRWRDQLAMVEFAVEDVPPMDDWNRDWVPLARTYAAAGALPTRVVVYRRPVETRARAQRQLRLLLSDVVVEQVAELLGLEPDDVDPLYGSARDD
jgi:predicted Zn-dependent protease with MMP-like domain